MTFSPSSESTTYLGHYELIAGVFDELDISDLIDILPPKKSGRLFIIFWSPDFSLIIQNNNILS